LASLLSLSIVMALASETSVVRSRSGPMLGRSLSIPPFKRHQLRAYEFAPAVAMFTLARAEFLVVVKIALTIIRYPAFLSSRCGAAIEAPRSTEWGYPHDGPSVCPLALVRERMWIKDQNDILIIMLFKNKIKNPPPGRREKHESESLVWERVVPLAEA